MKDFKEKIVVITGGAQGIGKALAEEFHDLKARVVIIDRQEGKVPSDLFYVGDISEKSVIDDFTKRVIKEYGSVDILINNACLSRGGIKTCDYDDFLYVQCVGVVAPFMLTKRFMPYFNKGASVINIASTRAFQSQEDTESYTATKGGIISLTHALAVSLKGKVRVNSISPGWIDTEYSKFSTPDNQQHLAGRIGNSSDITKAVSFLCSEDASFITGENLIVDGGMSKLMVYHNDLGWSFTP